MNVLFVIVSWGELPTVNNDAGDAAQIPKPLSNSFEEALGISYLSSFLQSHGHSTDLLVLHRFLSDAEAQRQITAAVGSFRPDVVGFTVCSRDFARVSELAQFIKTSWPSIFLMIGGPHVTVLPEEGIQQSFDAVCIGEGEHAMLAVVEQLSRGERPSEIPSLWIKSEGRIERNTVREFNKNLDALPFPDRRMWERWVLLPDFIRTISVSRGCPYRCTYCLTEAFRAAQKGKYTRFRSVASVISELREVSSRYPKTRCYHLESEMLNRRIDYLVELCQELEQLNRGRAQPLGFSTNIKPLPRQNHDEMFGWLKRANIHTLFIGLESGSERIRSEILDRHYSNRDFLSIREAAKRHDLFLSVFVLVGLPGETLADFEETVAFTRELKPDQAWVNIFFPYPGTRLHKTCEQMGLITGPLDYSIERAGAPFDLPGFTKEQILDQRRRFHELAGLDPEPVGWAKLLAKGGLTDLWGRA